MRRTKLASALEMLALPLPRALAEQLTPRRMLLLGLATFIVLIVTFPLIWMASTSLKPNREVLAWPPYFMPRQPTLENFWRLFTQTYFLTHFKNSLVCATASTLLSIAIGTMGGYSLTRFRYWGREKIAVLTLLTYMFPPIVLIIPFFILFRAIGLVNSYPGLILAYVSFSLPFSVWLLRAFFRSIPLELEEAAMVDGANRFQAVVYIVMPLALPGIIATSIFTFIVAWNDYLFARILMGQEELKTLPVGVQDFFNMAVIDWGMIMAAGMMITIPALVFFISSQKYLIEGWGTGAVKG
jgi:ABC-type glycerol-3-phosphate transport system permease component